MDTYCTKVFAICIIWAVLGNLSAQQNFNGFMQPQVTVAYKVTPLYSHTHGIEERNYVNEEGVGTWRVQQLDIFHFSQLRILDNQSIAVGIQYRFREVFSNENRDELRFTEQYAITKRGFAIRYGHRIRAEQRIQSNQTEHRMRYRFMLDFPLWSQDLDINEIYLALGTESLWSMGVHQKPVFDQRIMLDFGWFFS